MTVETPDETTAPFKLPAPKAGLLAHFAMSCAQAFQPRHFHGRFHSAGRYEGPTGHAEAARVVALIVMLLLTVT